jgi:hypothetical protein
MIRIFELINPYRKAIRLSLQQIEGMKHAAEHTPQPRPSFTMPPEIKKFIDNDKEKQG